MKTVRCLIPCILLCVFFSCTTKEKKTANFMKEGMEKMRTSDSKGAIADFTQAIKLQPASYEAYYYRANAYFNIKKADEAIVDYSKAIELKPGYADAYFNRGLCKQYMKNMEGACSDWVKADALGKANIKDYLKYCQ